MQKLVALLRTFCDSMLFAGYTVVAVDLQQIDPARVGVPKRWRTEVIVEGVHNVEASGTAHAAATSAVGAQSSL